jgi:SAM-dependent methyltransferase
MMQRRGKALEPTLFGVGVVGHNKLCELEDFDDPSLRRYLDAIFAGHGKRLLAFAAGREHRKAWEVAQAARALVDFGAAHVDAELLGVAAGTEETIFWLTNHARRVHAIDLYLDPGGWEADAPPSMLIDPGEYATCPWNDRRLVVQHMDARKLRYEDESFDGIFSSSSIEHFGEREDVHRALAEMWRVLKPGGVVSLSTEYRVRGPGPGLSGTLIFDAAEIDDIIVRPFAWELVEPLDLRLSERTRATELPLAEAGGRYPHLVLREGELAFTSVHLALRKAIR